jgi:hypothetical protein
LSEDELRRVANELKPILPEKFRNVLGDKEITKVYRESRCRKLDPDDILT